MKDFILAALPWALTAIAVVIFCVRVVRKNKMTKEKTIGFKGDCMTIGMCFGMCVGAVLGMSGIMGITLAMPLCVLIGEVVGILIKY